MCCHSDCVAIFLKFVMTVRTVTDNSDSVLWTVNFSSMIVDYSRNFRNFGCYGDNSCVLLR